MRWPVTQQSVLRHWRATGGGGWGWIGARRPGGLTWHYRVGCLGLAAQPLAHRVQPLCFVVHLLLNGFQVFIFWGARSLHLLIIGDFPRVSVE